MKLPMLILCSVVAGACAFWLGKSLPGQNAQEMVQKTAIHSNFSNVVAPELVDVAIKSGANGYNRIAVQKYEVTFGEWQLCVDAGACDHSPKRRNYVNDDHPVSGVSWHDVQQYISWISQATGQDYRLPRENEWRFLATNVLDKKVKKLFDDPRLSWAADYANFGKRAERRTYPVGRFGEEESGVADIAGNVWEWTDTCWRDAGGLDIGHKRKDCGGVRVLAGSHMTYQSELVRFVPTGGCSIGFPPANIGFRLVRSIADEAA